MRLNAPQLERRRPVRLAGSFALLRRSKLAATLFSALASPSALAGVGADEPRPQVEPQASECENFFIEKGEGASVSLLPLRAPLVSTRIALPIDLNLIASTVSLELQALLDSDVAASRLIEIGFSGAAPSRSFARELDLPYVRLTEFRAEILALAAKLASASIGPGLASRDEKSSRLIRVAASMNRAVVDALPDLSLTPRQRDRVLVLLRLRILSQNPESLTDLSHRLKATIDGLSLEENALLARLVEHANHVYRDTTIEPH